MTFYVSRFILWVIQQWRSWPCVPEGRQAPTQQSASVVYPASPSASEPLCPSTGPSHLYWPLHRTETNPCYPEGQTNTKQYSYLPVAWPAKSYLDQLHVIIKTKYYWCSGTISVLHSGQCESHVGICGRGEPLETVKFVWTIHLGNGHCLCAISCGQMWKNPLYITKSLVVCNKT